MKFSYMYILACGQLIMITLRVLRKKQCNNNELYTCLVFGEKFDIDLFEFSMHIDNRQINKLR